MDLRKYELADFQQEVKDLVIENDDQLELANAIASKGNELKKEVVAKYKKPKEEANKAHKAITKAEKDELKPIENGLAVLKTAIGGYLNKKRLLELEQKKKEQEELKAIQELELAIDGEISTLEIVKEKEVKPNIGGTHIRHNWKARVTDASKVPQKWGNISLWKVDEEALARIATNEKENHPEIKGVEFYDDVTTVIR